MAQRVQILLEDDIDGGTAEETLTFAVDGVTYEIDLNKRNSKALRKALEPYVAAGRRVSSGRSKGGPARGAARTDPSQLAKMREWARANGYEVADKGRVSKEIREAYANAKR